MDVSTADYDTLKYYFDNVLNKNKEHFETSNDEPTPIGCIEEMLKHVPSHLWDRHDLHILDPCCGNGNFHIVIYTLLLALGREPKHILEQTLYFNDINKQRLENVRNTFCHEEYELNVSSNDFLTTQYTTKFDLVVANPPYAKLLDNGKRASKNHNLIKLFLEKTLDVLKEDGFLVFITPDNWMSYADRNEIIKKLTSLQIHHLNIHCAKKFFKKIGSSFTWYVIENRPYYKGMCVEGINGRTHYKSIVPSKIRSYIPLYFTDIVYSICEKTIDADIQKFLVETTSDLHKFTKKELISDEADEKHPYRLIHTPKQTVYAERPHKYQEGYKVFISTTDKYRVFVDNCGMTQSIAFIRCASKDEAYKIKVILEHPLYVFLNNICRWGNFNNIRILQSFPIPTCPESIYTSFGLGTEEIKIIENYLN